MSKLNKFQGKTEIDIAVSDMVLRNLATGVETFIDTVVSESLEKTSSTEQIKAGIYANALYSIASGEEITLGFSDAVDRPELSNTKWNATEKKGTIVKTCFPANYEVQAGGTILLPYEPLSVGDVLVYQGETNLEEGTDFTIEGATKTITISKAGINQGDSLFVTSFEYEEADSDYFEVGEGASALAFEIIRKKPIFDTNLQIIKWKVQHFGKCTLVPEASESFETERQAVYKEYSFAVEKRADLPYVFRTYYLPA